MLKDLKVKNYALIQHLEIQLKGGLTVVTGETGAGKSIVLGALGLLMGRRADSKVLFDEQEKCVVEGLFDISNYDLEAFFEENDLDFEPLCHIRREINTSGKSRAFVNDTPVNLEQLQALSSFLIDIHSQHDNLILTSEPYQMRLLDAFCGAEDLSLAYSKAFQAFNQAKKAWKALFDEVESKKKEREFETYVFNELEAAKLVEGEYDQLEQQLKEMDNAQEIAAKVEELKRLLDEDDFSLVNNLTTMVAISERLATLASGLKPIKDRLKSVYLEAKDIAAELGKTGLGASFDEQQLMEKRNRFDALNTLMLKHKCKTFEDLLQYRDGLAEKYSKFDSVDDELLALEKQMNEAQKQAAALATELSAVRNEKKGDLEAKIADLLKELSMKDSVLKWELTKTDTLGKNGWDSLRLLFSANKGFEPKEIKNTASGGEFSRLMLCLKYILAEKSKLPTLIFDEIDTGISGDVALKMARLMKNMSSGHQLMAITHLPQIAASGDAHFFVFKNTEYDKTISAIKPLSREERLREIAVMMSGNEFSASAKDSAAELMAAFN